MTRVSYNSLTCIESGPITDESLAQLKSAINGNTSLLAAKAVEVAANLNLYDLIPDMITAFERFMIDGVRNDKLCNAKTTIVDALNKLEYMGDEVFLKGAYYIQMEPAFGKPIDAAVKVRIGCAFGLARIIHPDASYILTDLLIDTQSEVRTAAVKALSYLARTESELLLRLKIHVGDEDPEVMQECFNGLAEMAPERSLDFIAQFLRSSDPALAQYAALAIGNSRLSRAYDMLREYWDDFPSSATRRMLLLPIALIRSIEAFNFLLDVVRNAEKKTAAEALYALRIYPSADSIEQIGKAAKSRKDAELMRIFESEF